MFNLQKIKLLTVVCLFSTIWYSICYYETRLLGLLGMAVIFETIGICCLFLINLVLQICDEHQQSGFVLTGGLLVFGSIFQIINLSSISK
jgi:prepilin signal peptidase PulO-like enzyme (type II secretory pathway)